MKIAILGYGRMGHEVAKQAQELSIPVSKTIDDSKTLAEAEFSPDEIVIDFTEPGVVVDNVKLLAAKGVSIVCGTTGWQSHLEEIRGIVTKNNIGFLYASNFSLGVNLFWLMLDKSARLINKFKQYDVLGHETHHKNKLDSPSGTALTTANILLKNLDHKDSIVTDKLDRALKANELHFSSTRGGYVIGEHSVLFDSPHDEIKISHCAKNRQGFAAGAIECARWLHTNNKKGFLSINDYFEELLHE